MNINSLKNRNNFSSLNERNYLINNFIIEARVAFAKSKGLYHSVEDPEGLKEITPGLKAQQDSWATTEYYYSVEKDGRVHKMMHGQYEYLYGPADMGVITFDEWFDLPLNFWSDLSRVVDEKLDLVTDPVYSNKDLIPELKAFVATFEC
nr:MAG TPA: hypothetical protein [Bacteriophage sp.]